MSKCKECKFLNYDVEGKDWICCNEIGMYYADFVEPGFLCVDFEQKSKRNNTDKTNQERLYGTCN